jgi:hypothetical protein
LSGHRRLVLEHVWQPPVPPRYDGDNDDTLAYHNEEAKDDSDDFVTCVFHDWHVAMVEGRKFDFPPAMTDEEIERLGVLVSEVDRPV